MRLAITADLHLPITPIEKIAMLADEMAAHGPDALVVAGDVAESLEHLEQLLTLLKSRLPCPILILAGNHDVWIRPNQFATSRELWEELIPRKVEKASCTWFEGQAHIHDGVAVAGTIGWYDYSAADRSVQASVEAFRDEKRHFNMDGYLINWPWTDQEFCAIVARPFLATLDRLEADPAVRQTVVVTHVPLLECQMCRRPHDQVWSFTNAYFGNLTLGREVLKRKKVTHVISGHTHVGREQQLRLDDGRTIDARVLASEYRRPAWLLLELPS